MQVTAVDSGSGCASLAAALIEAGASLLRLLDSEAVGANVACWLWFSDLADWRLVLAEGPLCRYGSKIARDRLLRFFDGSTDFGALTIAHVAVAKRDTHAVRVLRSAIQTGPGIHGIRIRDNVLNGVRIRGAYIYRVV